MIEDGTFLIHSDLGEELARVSKGSCFGELALLRQARSGGVLQAGGRRAWAHAVVRWSGCGAVCEGGQREGCHGRHPADADS